LNHQPHTLRCVHGWYRGRQECPVPEWTNGFVERLQQTILHEHWRIAFRRRYFRKRFQLQVSLEGFLRFYNFECPHQGYRTKGRTPAEVFWGAVNHEVHQEV
jgi:hypothetical protein